MIVETVGNLFENNAESAVNTANCVGAMGKGIALQFRQKFSEDFFKDYKTACKNGDLQIGKIHIYLLRSENSSRFIINFPTKDHWRD